jgi:hypothetical protein
MDENGWEWLRMDENGWEWQGVAGNARMRFSPLEKNSLIFDVVTRFVCSKREKERKRESIISSRYSYMN